MGNYLIGTDVGTTGAKSVLIDDEGNSLASFYIEYPLITPRPGWGEHNPEDYWNAVAGTIKSCIQKSGVSPKEIRGISVSALAPACILVDSDLKPLQNSHIWMDRRGTQQSEWVKAHLDTDYIRRTSGNPIDPYYATIKLMWERDNRPELYKKAFKIQTAADYPCMKLCGKTVTDYSNASLFGPGFDIVNKRWDENLIEQLGLDMDKFPEVFPCDEIVGEVTREAAEQTGLAMGTPVMAGTVDANAAWIAGGAIDNGEMSLAMGTAGVMGVVHKEPKFTPDMITIIHGANSRDTYTTVAATAVCGGILRYFKDNFANIECLAAQVTGLDIYDILCDKAFTVRPGSDGLITLPYMMGERTPIWDPIARGAVFGLSLTHTKEHLLRSFLEGSCLALKHNYEMIRAGGVSMNLPLVLTEGGAKSPFWRQLVSDVLNVPCVYMKNSKGAPFGNAVVAGVGSGIFKDYSVTKQWVEIGSYHEPDPQNSALYEEIFHIYLNLYKHLKGDYQTLANLTGYS